jgi:hypothetical protein
MKVFVPIIASTALILTACATEKVLQATGGSRADGTVELSYEYGMFEQPHIHTEEALETATKRCAAWGYTGAEPFGGQKNQCEQFSQYGCTRNLVTISYQCTGTPPSH